MVFRKGILLVCCFVSWGCRAQNPEIDSINYLLDQSVANDSAKAALFLQKAMLYQGVQEDSVFLYAREGTLLATSAGSHEQLSTGLLLLGYHYWHTHQFEAADSVVSRAWTQVQESGNREKAMKCLGLLGDISYARYQYEKALLHYQAVAKLCTEKENQIRLINTLGVIAEIHRKKEDYVLADSLFLNVKKLAEEQGYEPAVVMSYINLGKISSETGRYSRALEQFDNGLVIARRINASRMIPVLLHNMGTIYLEQENNEKSLQFINEAYALYQQNHDKHNMLICLNDLGSIFRYKEDYASALEYYREALQIAGETEVAPITATILNNIGHLYGELSNFSESVNFLNRGLEMAKATRSRAKMLYSYLGLGSVYFKSNKLQQALAYANKSLAICREIGQVEHRNEVHELLSEIYVALGRYKEAYQHQVLYKHFTDSVLNLQNARKITRMEMEYQFRESQLSAQLKEEQLIRENERTKESLADMESKALWLLIGILTLSLMVVLIYLSNSIRSLRLQTKNVLTEQKLLRSQMTPHFMFNSLSVLQGIILNKEYDKSLKYLSKFSGLLRLSLENSMATLVPLSKELLAIEQYLIVQNIARKVPFNYEIKVIAEIDPSALLIPPMLIQPFVENAVKHGLGEFDHDQKIEIILNPEKQYLKCEILDNGVGVNTHQDRFGSRVSGSTRLIRERLMLLGKEFKTDLGVDVAEIVEEDGRGTRVTIRLPYKNRINDESADSRG